MSRFTNGRRTNDDARASGPARVIGADGLDTANWDLLCESIAAAHRGNAEAHASALRRLENDLPVDVKAGAYLRYLLRYRIAVILGHRPSHEDLVQISENFYPKFARIIRGDRSQFEDTILTVFELASEDRKVKGGRALVLGTAALGVMLDDPENELAAMRPNLAKWWQRNAEHFGSA